MADGMDDVVVLQLGPGRVFVDGDYVGDSARCVGTEQRWPEIVIDDPLEADEVG